MITEDVVTADVVEKLNNPTGEAICLPNAAYTSPAILEREVADLFEREWVFAAAGAQIPARGDVLPVTLAGRPILLVRDRDGSVKGFHNVCRHRGMQLVNNQQHGCTTLVCPYHAWTYSLDGRLRKTPHFGGYGQHDVPDLDRNEYGLAPVAVSMWHDLIFVNISADAAPLAERMQPLADRWAGYDLSALRYGGGATFDAQTNWKLAIENFVESYHLPWTHPSLNNYSRMQDHYSMVEAAFLGQGSRRYSADFAGHPDLPLFPGLAEELHTVAEYPYVMPNLMLGIHPSYLFVFGIQPVSPDHSREFFYFYFAGDAAMTDTLAEQRLRVMDGWKGINAEDITMIEGMQRGRRSPGYHAGRFSPYHEVTTHEFQRRVANRLNGYASAMGNGGLTAGRSSALHAGTR